MERFVGDVRRPGPRPPLYVAHFEVPHVPWRILPSGRQYPVHGTTLPGPARPDVERRTAFVVGQATQRHMLQVGYADRLLRRLIRRLRARAGCGTTRSSSSPPTTASGCGRAGRGVP